VLPSRLPCSRRTFLTYVSCLPMMTVFPPEVARCSEFPGEGGPAGAMPQESPSYFSGKLVREFSILVRVFLVFFLVVGFSVLGFFFCLFVFFFGVCFFWFFLEVFFFFFVVS